MKNKLIAFVLVFAFCLWRAADKDLAAWTQACIKAEKKLPFDFGAAIPRWIYGGITGAISGGAVSAVIPE